MSPEATSTAGRGYFDLPFKVNQFGWTMAISIAVGSPPRSAQALSAAGYPDRADPARVDRAKREGRSRVVIAG